MINNFFKTTLRAIWKNRSYSFLNIFGLAIGIACAGFIFLWVEDEVSYDNIFSKKDLLYNIRENQTYDGLTRTFRSTPGPMAEAIKREIPGIVNTCRLNNIPTLFSLNDKAIFEKGCYADSSIFNIFSLDFKQGNAQNAFKQLNAVVISEKMAKQFFGDDNNVIGKSLKMDNREDFLVSGVIKDLPSNTTLQFDWIAPFEIYFKQRPYLTNWGANGTNTYVELAPGANLAAINKQLFDFIEKKQAHATARCFLFAMNDWRLRDNFEGGKQNGGRIEYVRMFTIIAWIILLIACINFMNLATARSEKRAKEVGVRKVMGAGKKTLFLQFITESLFLSALAVIIGVFLIILTLPAFNTLVEKSLSINLSSPLHIGGLIVITLLCGLLSGSYPAIYLSAYNPVFVLKGIKQKNGGATWIRKGLVVTQFTVSIVLIISTAIVYQQVQHVKSRDLGYDKDHLLSIPVHGNMTKNFTVIKQELINSGDVENAGLNSFNTMDIGNNGSGLDWNGKDKSKDILVSMRSISPELISTLGLHLKEGRLFKPDIISDSNNVIITETFAKLMGKESAIGKVIKNGGNENHTVVGVVNDYLYGDMYGQSDPIMFFSDTSNAKYMYVRLNKQADIKQVLAKIETVLKKYNPAYPFEYTFVDDQFNQQFKSESLIGKLSRLFTALAIVISCLGLFGLSAYTAERRTKEIGIRKVLGAGTVGIAGLLSKEFLQLVLIATFIAYPVAWWSMHKWLQGYAYRIHINWWIFLAAGLGAMLIALVTVSFQSVKAALSNPVKSLRTE